MTTAQAETTERPQGAIRQGIVNGTLRHLHDLFLWDTSEKQRLLRAATARGYDLDEAAYARPFPGGVSVLQSGEASPWKTILALGAAAAVAAGAWKLAGMAGGSTPPATPAAAAKASGPSRAKVELFYQEPDGRLTPLGGAASGEGAQVPDR